MAIHYRTPFLRCYMLPLTPETLKSNDYLFTNMDKTTVTITPQMLELLKQDKEKFHMSNFTEVIQKYRNYYYKIVPPQKKEIEEELKISPEELRKYSLVPEIMASKKFQFLDKDDEPVSICKKSPYLYQDKFTKPWIRVLTEKGKKLTSPNMQENTKSMEYEELEGYGFGVAVLGTRLFTPWFSGQQKKYILYKLTSPITYSRHIDRLPRGHYLQRDINNHNIRIIGQNTNPSGRGVWMNISDGSKRGYAGNAKKPISRIFRKDTYITYEEKWRDMAIDYIPLMITEDDQILCLPNFQEIQHIGAVGESGSGKSLFLNTLMFWEHKLLNRYCINLNDYQDQTKQMSMPTKSFEHMRNKIHASPCGLPLVYLHPDTDSLELDKRDRLYPNLKICLPIFELLENMPNYHKMDRSFVYFKNMKDDLLKCNSFEEMNLVIEKDLPEKQQKAMKHKLLSILEELNTSKISSTDAHAYLKIRDKNGTIYGNDENGNANKHPIITLMRAGFIPSILTGNIYNEQHFSAYMSYLINVIYFNQKRDPYFQKHSISLFVDEVDRLYQTPYGGALVKKSLGNIGTNARSVSIGCRWSSQSYNLVIPALRTQTKFLFVFKIKNEKVLQQLEKDWSIPKHMRGDVLQFKTEASKEKFEMLAMTSESFILIDMRTGDITKTSKPQKGCLIPSPARHYHPT